MGGLALPRTLYAQLAKCTLFYKLHFAKECTSVTDLSGSSIKNL